MTQKYNIAVAGATGAVGTEIIQILEQRDFPIDNLYLLASSKSKGKKIDFKDNEINNALVFKENFSAGLSSKKPFDLIIIDCPQYNIDLDLLNQLNMGGRIIYIEKINEELSKAYKMIKYRENYSKEFLFDVFSNFYLTKKKEGFNFWC